MAVRAFNGTSDVIVCSPGNAGIKAGPFTYALLAKLTADNALEQLLVIGGAVNAAMYLGKDSSPANGTIANSVAIVRDEAAIADAIAWTVATGWVVVAITKASGTVAPVMHLFPLGGAWTHTASATTVADATTAVTQVGFGGNSADGFGAFKGAVGGIWNVAMTNTQVQELATNLRTSDWFNASAGNPKGLWEFNQASTGTSVLDLTGGGANQSAITGTSVVTGDDPPGWTFDGKGLQTLLPSADVTTTGWASTPLFSKINDGSDSTNVTATLA